MRLNAVMMIMIIIIIIQFNSRLFTCKLNSPKGNYKVCTRNNKNLRVKMTVYIIITKY
jgi:hypothetical protein